MKFFCEIEKENNDVVIQQPRVDFQKRGLLKSVGNFSVVVLEEIERWLFSFPSGMTKDAFQRQMQNLDTDSNIAISQLKSAYGFRVIKRYKKSFPVADKSFVEFIASDQLFITITGTKSKCEKYVLSAIQDLKQFGTVYILDCAILFAEYKSSRERGNSDDKLSQAHKCDFLIIENLAQPIGYVSNVACWALIALVNARVELKKPILCRYNEYRKLAPLYEKCIVHEVG